MVSLSEAKKLKYSLMIMDWKTWPTHILKDIKGLYGKLLHTCSVIPSRCTYLTNLEAMLATGHNHLHVPQSANKGVSPDLDWWLSLLQWPTLS